MAKVDSSIFIDAPAEQVFRRIAQHDRCNDWLVFVRRAYYPTPQTTGVGTLAHQEGEILGRKMEWDGEVVEWVDNERIVWKATSGQPKRMKMRALNRVRTEGGGARYSLEVHYEMPYSLIGKALDVLWVRRRLKEDLRKSVERLKAVLEGG
ncbi:MAG: hypothetical protein GTO63_17470 [Anaerolineae bacterium]|nr:hypothetical protein [Anaerolineae bacterium]